jgi:hypothetical protein
MAHTRPAKHPPRAVLPDLKPRPISIRPLLPGSAGRAGRPVVERRNLAARARLTQRISGEFQEMPGLRLTLVQARRLLGLPEEACARLLSELVREGLLRRIGDGHYVLRDTRP